METRNSIVKTPLNRVLTQRRSRSYRRSWRSCVEATSHFGYTPGQLTALRVPTSRKAPKSRDITKHVDPDQVALLVKGEWRLSYVTPLHRFRYTLLKSYSKQMSAFIVSEKQQGLAVEVGPESDFKVTFSVVLGLAETDEDAETIIIQIQSRPLFAAKDDVQKVVWSGWLTCVNGDPIYLRSLPLDFVCLPLFCSRGPETLTAIVKSWFQRTFDCCFGTLGINSTNLQWLASLWTGCHPDNSIQHLKLVWTMPTVPPMDVTYTVNSQDAWELWNSLRQEQDVTNDSSVDLQEVNRFMQGLEAHFYRHFRVDLSAGQLVQVTTALGSAHHSGKVKIANSSYMTTILMLLTECALLKMPI
ncbi:centromere protein L [Hypomesus transpacificus]|uniref:centromere protein L n=1 Tax=Hypomesus transpacificus TaxID=137520 RepID=UPI001F081AD5|nr:centromere protein L [Hypomesus transpacificus]